MLVDEYEQYQNNNDRTDVVVVSRSGSEEPEPEPLATDRKGPPRPLRYGSIIVPCRVPQTPQRRDRNGDVLSICAAESNSAVGELYLM